MQDVITVDESTCTLARRYHQRQHRREDGRLHLVPAIGADTRSMAEVTLTKISGDAYGPARNAGLASEMTIEGHGHMIRRDHSASAFRLVTVLNGGNLSLNQLTLSGGAGGPNGGAIYVRSATLAVSNSTLSGNSASPAGGVIWALDSSVALAGSTLSGNTASYGGSIGIVYGSLTIANSTLSSNSATLGGAIEAVSGSIAITNSTLYENSATNGGALDAFATSLTMANCTFSHNSASNFGGGIAATRSTVTVANSTMSGNSTDRGGGIYSSLSSSVALQRSLIAGNVATSSGNELYNSAGTIDSSHNVFGHGGENGSQAFYGFAPAPSDIDGTSDGANVALAAILDPMLAANGGPYPDPRPAAW